MSQGFPGGSTVFPDVYGRLLAEFAEQIGERQAEYGQPSRSVREELVRCVWFGGHFSSDALQTDDGRRLEVRSPGWWNVEGGPDFANAELLLEGKGRLVGNVEVHTASSAWYAHGHHRQPEYNDVVLHVVMWNDRGEPTVRAEDGRDIPQLTLSRVVEQDLEELVEIIEPEGEAPADGPPPAEGRYCATALREGTLDPQWVGRLLDAAGDHRLFTRAEALGELFENHPREQILYERIAEALGYKNNRMPFLQLAGLLPVATLRRRVPPEADPAEKSLLIEGAFFSVGGFLKVAADPDADPETCAYVEALRQASDRFGQQETSMRLSPEHWHFAGTRPVNYPPRRVAALARLCAAHLHDGLFNHFIRLVNEVRPKGRHRLDTAIRNALTGEFQKLEHPYWSFRYAFGGKRLIRARALVGKERALSIVVDVLLPVLLAHASAAEDATLAARLRALWEGLPRRAENAITRRMERMIFGSQAAALRTVRSARRQQGLHQLYRDCCHAAACERCVLQLAHRAGHALAPA